MLSNYLLPIEPKRRSDSLKGAFLIPLRHLSNATIHIGLGNVPGETCYPAVEHGHDDFPAFSHY